MSITPYDNINTLLSMSIRQYAFIIWYQLNLTKFEIRSKKKKYIYLTSLMFLVFKKHIYLFYKLNVLVFLKKLSYVIIIEFYLCNLFEGEYK